MEAAAIIAAWLLPPTGVAAVSVPRSTDTAWVAWRVGETIAMLGGASTPEYKGY